MSSLAWFVALTASSAQPCAPKAGPFQPLPEPPELDPARVELGRRLFTDGRLSRDGSISCATCHPLDAYGADGRRVSVGIDGRRGRRNAPTVFNASIAFRQFRDGSARTLEEQVDAPIRGRSEMDTTWQDVIARLDRDPELRSTACRLNPGCFDVDLIRGVIADFERTLITSGAAFDRYLCGEDDALDSRAREGFELFDMLGCSSCHQGAGIGGNLFQHVERGRRSIRLKVPSLRNVAETAPYFHVGRAAKLEDAVREMGSSMLGLELGDEDVAKLVAFLRSLTGSVPAAAGP